MKVRNIVWGSLLVALLALSAYIKIPTPVAPLTFSVQILLVGALVTEDAKTPLVAVVTYLLMGFSGLPVFSSGGGLACFLTPTAGFLIGYLPCVMLVSKMKNKGEYIGCIIGLISLYVVGLTYFILISEVYLGGFPLPLFGVCALFLTMLIKDILLVFPIILLSRKIRKAKKER